MIEMTEADYKIAKRAARRYLGAVFGSGSVDYDDLYAEAVRGALYAVTTFDPAKGRRSGRVSFYARTYISQYLLDHGRTVYIPPRSTLVGSEKRPFAAVSLDLNADGSPCSDAGETVARLCRSCDEPHVEAIEVKSDLKRILSKIDPRRASIMLEVSRGFSFVDIGRELGLSRERVRQLYNEGILRAREVANR